MATIAEVRDRAANDLGLLRVGQSLQAQDNTRITAAYNEVYAHLKNDGLATWTSTGDIPTELVPHVVAYVAQNCLNTYSVSLDRYQRILNSVVIATKELPKLVTKHYVSQEEATDF